MYAIKRNLKIYVCTCVMADQLYAEGNGAYFDFIRNMVNLSRINFFTSNSAQNLS